MKHNFISVDVQGRIREDGQMNGKGNVSESTESIEKQTERGWRPYSMSLLGRTRKRIEYREHKPPDRQTGKGAAAVIAIKAYVLNIPL